MNTPYDDDKRLRETVDKVQELLYQEGLEESIRFMHQRAIEDSRKLEEHVKERKIPPKLLHMVSTGIANALVQEDPFKGSQALMSLVAVVYSVGYHDGQNEQTN